jgi:hypothetical protein
VARFKIEGLESNNRGFLSRVFEFLEELSRSDDIKIQEVVSMTVLEKLVDKPEWTAAARQSMGPKTSSLADEVETYWKARKRDN